MMEPSDAVTLYTAGLGNADAALMLRSALISAIIFALVATIGLLIGGNKKK